MENFVSTEILKIFGDDPEQFDLFSEKTLAEIPIDYEALLQRSQKELKDIAKDSPQEVIAYVKIFVAMTLKQNNEWMAPDEAAKDEFHKTLIGALLSYDEFPADNPKFKRLGEICKDCFDAAFDLPVVETDKEKWKEAYALSEKLMKDKRLCKQNMPQDLEAFDVITFAYGQDWMKKEDCDVAVRKQLEEIDLKKIHSPRLRENLELFKKQKLHEEIKKKCSVALGNISEIIQNMQSLLKGEEVKMPPGQTLGKAFTALKYQLNDATANLKGIFEVLNVNEVLGGEKPVQPTKPAEVPVS